MRKYVILCMWAAIVTTAMIGFFYYSVANGFSNWPWTRTTKFTSGTVYGIRIGDPKEQVSAAVAIGLKAGRFSSVEPLRPEDELPESNEWHVGLTSCNCWLELQFKDNRLRSVLSRRYDGPTE